MARAPGARGDPRLVDYLRSHLVVMQVRTLGPLVASGAVRVGATVGRIDSIIHACDVVTVEPAALVGAMRPQPMALVISHEDDEVLVIDKPAGMHVHPLGPHREGTLLNGLLWHAGARSDDPWGAWRPSPAHRLDRAASGLVAIAKRAAVHETFRTLLADGGLTRRYRAIVVGDVRGDAGTIDAPLGRDPALDYRRAIVADGQRAVTHWRVVERQGARTIVELDLQTGRTHQIRAHLASVGHPIVGDTLYATGGTPASVIALHAIELRFRHPTKGRAVVCASTPPASFALTAGAPGQARAASVI